jgi:hypothetical protein
VQHDILLILTGCRVRTLLNRPAAVCLDDLVDLFHQPNRLLKRDDDLLVVGDVFRGEGTTWLTALATPVVGPRVADLVAANVKIPYVIQLFQVGLA